MKFLIPVILTLSVWGFSTANANLFTPIDVTKQATAISLAKDASKNSKRHRLVSYDAGYFYQTKTAFTKKSKSNALLTLHLFDDLVIQARLLRRYQKPDGKTVWLGNVSGKPKSVVNLIVSEKSMTGNVRLDGELYQIRAIKDNLLRVSQFSEPKTLPNSTDVVSPSKKQVSQLSRESKYGKNSDLPINYDLQTGFTDTAELKVLVYYTSRALELHPDLIEQIELEFIDTNLTFNNSQVDATVSIAHMIEIDQSPLGSSPFNVFGNQQGPFKNVEALRNKYQADLVHLYPSFLSGACGKAYYTAFEGGYIVPDFGYGATSASYKGNLTTAHELGHNLGAAHERYVASSGTSNYGYSNIEHEFRTVMAYGSLW